ncbi:hypothetical protein Syun_025360 [Stephania yunnanensis]|uniref:Essential protein Yae1 N-terminal domain-containing protein n=1 Tax=Stephania yunnanensis TaxID=152371 RepID=A0AAP0EU51_9MAGN
MDEFDTSDAVNLSTAERNVVPSSYNCLGNDHDGDFWRDDDAFDLDREWHKRRSQFHTIGYRDGFIEGKEASAEEGFNDGFKKSVLVGYKWGLVRGVTSALSCLPIDLKEKLAGPVETKGKLQNLSESMCAISTKDAFQIFNDEILGSESSKQCEDFEGNSKLFGEQSAVPSCNKMVRYIQEFELLMESSAVRLHKME